MTCWQCGAALPQDAGFCRACGAFVRPRNMPVSGMGPATLGGSRRPSSAGTDDTAAQISSSTAARTRPRPPFAASSTPGSLAESGETKTASATHATESSWSGASAAWRPPTSRPQAGIASSGTDSDSSLGEVLAGVGTGFVLISMLLSWYSVTITPLGVEFFESLERALFSRLFPQVSSGLGGLTGPLTITVSPLDKAAGGWRWAILVVSIVILLEILLAVSSGATNRSVSTWPHTAIISVLGVANLLLVVAAFLALPYGGAPAGYLTVSRGVGAYLGLVAALIACAGAIAVLLKNSPSGGPVRSGGLR